MKLQFAKQVRLVGISENFTEFSSQGVLPALLTTVLAVFELRGYPGLEAARVAMDLEQESTVAVQESCRCISLEYVGELDLVFFRNGGQIGAKGGWSKRNL